MSRTLIYDEIFVEICPEKDGEYHLGRKNSFDEGEDQLRRRNSSEEEETGVNGN